MLSVSALNALASRHLQNAFPVALRVAGEISALTLARSGHLYFSLKDAAAEVRCTLWASQARQLRFTPAAGQQVEVLAQVSFYEAKGTFQLNILAMQAAGAGALYEAFLRIRAQLQAEGLFDAERKRPIPRYPRTIGLVTSPHAAALHDVLVCLRERAPNMQVRLYPASVQGAQAPMELAAALGTAALRAEEDGLELVLLVRGGGSPEDLAAFNDPTLARTLRACPVPVITGIGHETDTSIADLAADLRAATPTRAAEIASEGFFALRARLPVLARTLHRAFARQLLQYRQRLDLAAHRLRDPRQQWQQNLERLRLLRYRFASVLRADWSRRRHRLELARRALTAPDLRATRARLAHLDERLHAAQSALLRERRRHLAELATRLRLLAPQTILARGYAFATLPDGEIIRRPAQLPSGAVFTLHLAEGKVPAQALPESEADAVTKAQRSP
ncbi:MAG: exodeoxyribonuclease VII large subunit [Rhodocyclaceae bacterium]|nr:exodeoxyribonuclease VII large subunit [Rhodocyclaceae bacterium]